MGTWFDLYRGAKQGRVEPSTVTPTDGSNVFILGADGIDESAIVSNGDYTEIKQLVDLSGYDKIGATLETIGVAMASYQPTSGFVYDPNTVFEFDLNVGTEYLLNKVENGFQLDHSGQIEVSTETYSPDSTYCRRIPEGVSTSRLLGTNNPQAFPTVMTEWTFQWWMNFDSSVYTVSTGIAPVVFNCATSSVGGLGIELSGVAGVHSWLVLVRQSSLGANQSRLISGFAIDPPPGWNLYTLRYRHSNSAPNQLELFVNDTLEGGASSVFTAAAAQPNTSEQIIYGSNELVGEIDAVRLLNRYMSDVEISDSYHDCVDTKSYINTNWKMQILVDDHLYAERTIVENENRTWTDFFAPVRILNGTHEVSFRLKFEEV